ncbi:MAG: endonuclease/exonuclease/phosphatase family protein [Deltaproteobacteria bacterium]|nr:endonuclease/exonuclease/phosphatase family protein [Deltaproteobacteria bacterium]
MKLRILSYNIHKGFSVGNQKFVLSKIRDALRGVDVDIVFLQEVLGAHDEHARTFEDWPLASQFEFLADQMWPHFAYGKNAIYEAGHHGNAILSRFPILEHSNCDISTNSLERRGILHAGIHIPDLDLKVHCLNVHLNIFGRSRARQLEKLKERITGFVPSEEPYILAGDFNDWSSRASKLMEDSLGAREVFRSIGGTHAATYPSRLPLLKLDRIYVRGFAPQQARVLTGAPWHDLSDHAPIYCDVTLDKL